MKKILPTQVKFLRVSSLEEAKSELPNAFVTPKSFLVQGGDNLGRLLRKELSYVVKIPDSSKTILIRESRMNGKLMAHVFSDTFTEKEEFPFNRISFTTFTELKKVVTGLICDPDKLYNDNRYKMHTTDQCRSLLGLI